ncbi:hypothetical protein JCM14036_21440 [Desulfotomaculum defluvii]
MLKRLGFFVLLTILMLCFAIPGFAAENKIKKVKYEAQEITEKAKIKERALQGVSDLDSNEETKVKAKLTPIGLASEVEFENYVTTQKLKEVENEDGSISESFATTSLVTIMGTSMYDPKYDRDDSSSCDIWLTLYWDRIGSSSTGYYGQITDVKVTWDRLANDVSITGHKILASANGKRSEGGWTYDTRQKTFSTAPADNVAQHLYPPSTWGHVQYSGAPAIWIAGKGLCTISRGGSSWGLEVESIQGDMTNPF